MWVEGSVKKHFQRNNRPESRQSNKFYTHPGLHKLFHPTILDGRTWRGSWENTENMEKMENINHMTWHDKNTLFIYDSKHPIYDTKHSICDSNTPFYSIYGDGLKNYNIRARRTWSFVSSQCNGRKSNHSWSPVQVKFKVFPIWDKVGLFFILFSKLWYYTTKESLLGNPIEFPFH